MEQHGSESAIVRRCPAGDKLMFAVNSDTAHRSLFLTGRRPGPCQELAIHAGAVPQDGDNPGRSRSGMRTPARNISRLAISCCSLWDTWALPYPFDLACEKTCARSNPFEQTMNSPCPLSRSTDARAEGGADEAAHARWGDGRGPLPGLDSPRHARL